jgi:hypothetical protein
MQRSLGKDTLEMALILPYRNKDIEHYEKYYDTVFIPEVVESAHPKNAIILRNRFMVENCDLTVVYIEHKYGGAYKALQYAKRLGKQTINLEKI